MNAKKDLNQSIIDHYTDQPDRLPASIRTQLETMWNGRPVQLYALADLDDALQLNRTWLVLGPEHIVLVHGENGEINLRTVERSRIKDVKETIGLSCNRLTFWAGPGEPPLAEVRYTQRQRRAMENIKVILEQDLGIGQEVRRPADDLYAESVAEPIRNAQSAVSGSDLAIIWRLMGYLKPCRKEVIIGSVAAITLTAVSLLPPYLTGYIIDRVSVSPTQAGGMASESVVSLWWIIGLLAGVYGIREFCMWIRLRKMSMLGEFVAHDLRRDLYGHLQTLSLRFFSRKQTGSIISRVSSDTDRLWDFIAFGILEVSLSTITLISRR